MKKFNYIIGDIHGCYQELLELENIIKYHSQDNNASPFIISCGDLIDRGLYSKEVLLHFIKGKKNKTHTAILGNHELMMLQALEVSFSKEKSINLLCYLETYSDMFKINQIYFPELSFDTFISSLNERWIENGGRETLHSFGIGVFYLSKHKITDDIIEFLCTLPVFYEGDNFFVTHGIPNNNDLEQIKYFDNNYENLYNIRKIANNIIWNKKVPDEVISNKLNISGHTPFKNVKKLEKQNAIQIDTGCVYGNKLTAYCVETNSFLYVDAQNTYKNKKLF